MQITYTLSDIEKAVIEFWKTGKKFPVIAFSGDLGAGKTTFISTLCHYLKVKEIPSSPTFALINEYTFLDVQGKNKTIFHTDFYRLKSEDEAVNAGIEEIFMDKEAYCFIEWPEKASGLLPKNTLQVYLEVINENTRILKL